jgi:cytochrome c heme-lyase
MSCPVPHQSESNTTGCPVQHDKKPETQESTQDAGNLSQARQVSSIPNTKGGFWVYPSEHLFYNALKRKQNNSLQNVNDLQTIIPVHNIVNEKCWEEIKKWEALEGNCPPKLVSFIGRYI